MKETPSYSDIELIWIENYLGLKKYKSTIEQLHKQDISKRNNNNKEDYQKNFNTFYKVRRNKEWQQIYYDFFEKNKDNSNLTFEEIITYLYKKTGNIEISFASKMLATINPNKPIWDKHVTNKLQLKLCGKTKDEKLKNAIIKYNDLEEKTNNLLNDENYIKIIANFKEKFKKYHLTDMKVLDFILWSIHDYNL